MKAPDELEYREFALARMPVLRRTAYLLCNDWHMADDLVATALDKLYRVWHRRSHIANLDGYVNMILSRAWLDEQRRPWRREWLANDEAPDSPADSADSGVADRLDLDRWLEGLGPRRRAVLVLRFYCDLTVEETAEILGVSEGTVKSQTARALQTLRAQATKRTER
ncbi:SigE family RNA polymerase sigma factor [Dactylosporangium sp. NPDC000555]|uniref:SigE family RNA polymerase sigma factor n=1 Tax=Dactylosporangium sp. NPDC000555 TaxID=3154260 RepID=UPI00331EDD76